MHRRIARLFVLAALAAGVAIPASAGVLDDAARRIRLTFDDADWKAPAGTWPLACTNANCVSLECISDGNSSDDTDEESLRAARDVQDELLDTLEMKAAQKPAIRTFGATKGVYRSYFSQPDAASFYVFDFMTLGPARRVKLTCEGETADGKPITKLFEKLLTGVELY